ncbi:MAG: hypothetical protein PHP65_04990 [Bacilli bacterium]|nr:hypothetical protein [Bacilli bacterium]
MLVVNNALYSFQVGILTVPSVLVFPAPIIIKLCLLSLNTAVALEASVLFCSISASDKAQEDGDVKKNHPFSALYAVFYELASLRLL